MLHLPDIRVEHGPDCVTVFCPYHPDWPARARNLGGKWQASQKAWLFDPRDAQTVTQALVEVYGWDGAYPVEILDARVILGDDKGGGPGCGGNELWLFGRFIAGRRHRDAEVRLGSGVILIQGGFAESGGSWRYPRLEAEPHTVVEVRDVTVSAFERDRRIQSRLWPDYITEVPNSRRVVQAPGTIVAARLPRAIVLPESEPEAEPSEVPTC